jgi:hypothetical protein
MSLFHFFKNFDRGETQISDLTPLTYARVTLSYKLIGKRL